MSIQRLPFALEIRHVQASRGMHCVEKVKSTRRYRYILTPAVSN